MENLLRKCYNDIKANSRVGEYKEVLQALENAIDDKEKSNLLEELYQLREIEHNNKLNESQKKRYLEIVELCRAKNIEIPFGIEI